MCKKTFLAYMGEDEEDDVHEESKGAEPEFVAANKSHLRRMDGSSRATSVELQGYLGSAEVFILVDTGSTHNFLHPRVAEALKLSLVAIPPFRVFVGNGQSLVCSNKSVKSELRIHGHSFVLEFHILPVHGADVILGMTWLRSLHRMTNDFDAETLEFTQAGRKICLHITPRSLKNVSVRSFAALMAHTAGAELFELLQLDAESDQPGPELELPPTLAPEVQRVLLEHQSVFSAPSGMPPACPYDHKIHLLPNTKPVNVRPYRYPYFQKNEIEKQAREMLDAGIIRRSGSAFSSPVLLIRKKDGTFRFCIDYRALNAVTVPDRFPIPTTDELFDELGAARFFTKLDLRSGYHQIRMHEADVYKIAFRTHDGHFEFLVMPFGLTNAPSTFQAAMNEIFWPLLRRFVIVFFDNILIYSSSITEHVQHLTAVLSPLQAQHFFIKFSKCSFCCTTVDYLGHIISEGKLMADPAKIEVMCAWPTPKSVKQLRGFLGLTGYYRRFIAKYAVLAAPLTDLLKKEAFVWSPVVEDSFDELK